MVPVSMLGDAAAAEAMVTQATKSNRSDRLFLEQLDNVHRFLDQEDLLHSVQPVSRLSTSGFLTLFHHSSRLPQTKRNHSQGEAKDEANQSMLFSLETDRLLPAYETLPPSPLLGKNVDLLA